MHSSFKISNLSDSQPLNIGVPSLFKVHSDRKSEEIKIFVDLSLEVSKLSATTEDQVENNERSQSLKVEPHSFSLVSTTVTKELLLAEERAKAREARKEKSQAQEIFDSNDSDSEPVSGQAERRRLFGGVKTKPNTRDPGKLSKVETPGKVKVDNKQIFRRSQLEKARALTSARPNLPTAPIPVSDLPPSAVRSPPSRSAPVNPLLQNLKPIPPSASSSPVKPNANKPDLISIQVPMAVGDGTQTMQTINIPRSVLAGASDRPILLTVTPKNGINKGQKQIVVLTKNNSGQTTASCHVPKSAGSVVGGKAQTQTTRTIISTAGQPQPQTPAPVPAKSVQLSPRSSTITSNPNPASPVKQPVVTRPQQQVIRGQIVQTSAGQMLVQGNKQILLGKNVLQNGKLVLSQAQLAALTEKTGAGGGTGGTGGTGGAGPGGKAGGGTVRRTMISASQLQSMMAGGQKVVSVGTNSGGQRVVRVISGSTPPKGVIQQTNGSASQVPVTPPVTSSTPSPATGTTPGSTASLSRILTALHNRGLVSQHQNGKFYYVGDKNKSPATASPGTGLKIATSPAVVPAKTNLNTSSSSVTGITSLKAGQSQQSSVVVAPALSLDSFTADSDMLQAATSLLSSDLTNGSSGSTQESHTEGGAGGGGGGEQESFLYRDPVLPTGWYIKVGKRQVAELSYEVEVSYFSPEGARLRSQEEVSSYLSGQLSVEDISHRPPVSLERMPWKQQLDEINKQLAPVIEVKSCIKRTAPDSVIVDDKRFKPDSFIRA